MTHHPTTKRPRLAKRTKTLIALLALSGLLNIALLGFIAARTVQNFGGAVVNTAYEDGMPLQVREIFSDELKTNRRQLLRTLYDLRQARLAQHEILTAPTLDAEALNQAQQEVLNQTQALLTFTQQTLHATATKLPDDVRQQIPNPKLGKNLRQFLTQPSGPQEN